MLGNLCHWTDFSLLMVPEASRYPIRLIPGRSAASDCDMALTMVFGDDSLVAITFTECETFEGVRENLHVRKGEMLISLADFEQLVIERGPRKTRVRSLFRDHGHRETVLASYRMSRAGGPSRRCIARVRAGDRGALSVRTRGTGRRSADRRRARLSCWRLYRVGCRPRVDVALRCRLLYRGARGQVDHGLRDGPHV